MVFAVWGGYFGKTQNGSSYASDVLFVLDVSQSMDALDIGSSSWTLSRLDAAKLFITKFVEHFPNNTYALQIFTGESVQVIPFTSDKESFLLFLQDLHKGNLSSWGNGVFWATQIALEKMQWENRFWAVIVLSDFEHPNTDFSEIKQTFQKKIFYKKENIAVVWIGIWSKKGEKILLWTDFRGRPLYKTYNNRPIITRYDAEVHKFFREVFDATSLALSWEKQVEKISKNIGHIPHSPWVDSGKTTQIFWFFIGLSYSFFVLFLFFTYSQKKKWYFSSLKNFLWKK